MPERPSAFVSTARRAARGSLLAALALSTAACWLDLDSLTRGGPSSAATGSGGGGGTGGGGGGSFPGALVLQCDPCPEGGCDAVTIAQGSTDALGAADIAVGADAVYWVNQEGNGVMRFSTGPEPEFLTGANAPRSIAVDGKTVFYVADYGVWACPADTCVLNKKQLASPALQGTLGQVAFDGTSVYWTDRGASESDGRVYGCDPNDCAAPKPYADSMIHPDELLVSGGQLFWADRGNGNFNGTIYQKPLGGGTLVLSSALVFPTAIAVDNEAIYYPSWQLGGTIWRCAKGVYCDAPAKVVEGQAGWKPFDVAVSGGRVYWSDTAEDTIRSCPTAGCGAEAPRVHASGRTGITRLALGQTCIFWVDTTNGGSVMKVGR